MSDGRAEDVEGVEWDESADAWENIERAGELIQRGREDEIPPRVLDEYRATEKRVNDVVGPMRANLFSRLGPQLRQAMSVRSVAQETAQRTARSALRAKDLIPEHKAHVPHVPGPDIESISESFAEAQAERAEREEQAVARAELTNQRLSDLAYILAQVERSNASTAQALEEMQEARLAAERAGTRQFWINIVIVVVLGVAAIFGPVILRWLGLD